jgi:hypothetical protein
MSATSGRPIHPRRSSRQQRRLRPIKSSSFKIESRYSNRESRLWKRPGSVFGLCRHRSRNPNSSRHSMGFPLLRRPHLRMRKTDSLPPAFCSSTASQRSRTTIRPARLEPFGIPKGGSRSHSATLHNWGGFKAFAERESFLGSPPNRARSCPEGGTYFKTVDRSRPLRRTICASFPRSHTWVLEI